jgi:hypothetical protein
MNRILLFAFAQNQLFLSGILAAQLGCVMKKNVHLIPRSLLGNELGRHSS